MSNKDSLSYNDIPVFFCSRCLSLNILTDDILGDYCPDCGCTDIREGFIWEWEELKKKQEKEQHINNLNYGKGRK